MAKFQVNTNNGKTLKLDDNNEIHRGGEGRIILLTSNKKQVAKIYHQGIVPISEKRFGQLQKIDNECFVKPLELLYQHGNIVGYLMEYAGIDYFPMALLFNRSFCQRNCITEKLKKSIRNYY